MIGFDIFILFIASTTAITLIGFAAKGYEVILSNWNNSKTDKLNHI